jgi:hypothetical protein
LAAAMFTNHPICDSIRTSAAANCVSSNEKGDFSRILSQISRLLDSSTQTSD